MFAGFFVRENGLISLFETKWWRWGDVFGLGKKEPIYEYEEISQISPKLFYRELIKV